MKIIYALIAAIFIALASITALLLIPSKDGEQSTQTEQPKKKKIIIKKVLPKENTEKKVIPTEAVVQKTAEELEAEKKAEEERIAAEKKAEEERIAAEKKAEEERIAAEKLQAKKELYAKRKARAENLKKGIFTPDYEKMHPEAIKKMEEVAGGKYDLRSVVPDLRQKGQNSFAIITTQEKIDGLKSFKDYVAHKKSLGFKVMVVTEKHWGGGTGVEAALNIRKWLKENYQKYKILYALMLGNPHPREGDVPFKKVSADWKKLKEITAVGMQAYRSQNPDFDGYDGALPTDFFYVDLSGDWDINKNGVYADDGDYVEGGIDGQWEIFVGRIPYYGVNAKIGNAQEVDKILERIIRYENQGGDLSWRHNIWYNGGVFGRDKNFWRDALQYNGALLYRQVVEHSGLPYTPEMTGVHTNSDHNAQKINTMNEGKFGYVHFQGHGFPGAGGGMSSRSAMTLDDTYPKVYTCGACDVASPEHPHNMMYALLRSSGVASYGGTRSVTGCSGPGWLKHEDYYPYFYFANSTGETLWRHRSLQAQRGRIGGTNFLINLYGDPSIIPMPQVHGDKVSISPGWKTVISMTEGTEPNFEFPYQIRNNTNKPQRFKLIAHKALKNVPTETITLAPWEYKKFTAKINKVSHLNAGTYDLGIKVMSTAKSQKEAGVTLKIAPKQMINYMSFNTPAIKVHKNSEGKEVPLDPQEVQADGVVSKAFKADAHGSKIKGQTWGAHTNFTYSFFVKLSENSTDKELLRNDIFNIYSKSSGVEVNISSSRWSSKRNNQKITGPAIEANKWVFISLALDRYNKKAHLTVGDKKVTIDLSIDPDALLVTRKLWLKDKGNGGTFYLDELTIHNYVLNDKETDALAHAEIVRPLFPKYGTSVNNKEVNFGWEASPSVKKFQLQVATDPDFKDVQKFVLAEHSYTLPKLEDGKDYYWRVNAITDRRKKLHGLTQKVSVSSEVAQINLRISSKINLPDAKVGVAGYNQKLDRFVHGLDRHQKYGTRYIKVSGPAWLLVHSDGTLFTNYGAKKTDKGKNEFVAKVVAPNGQSKIIEFTVTVK